MRRPICCMALVFFFMVLLSGSFSAFADGLIVRNGATLTLDGSTLDLNCLDLTIESGGTFEFASGIVTECGNLIVEVGGSFIEGTGTIEYCQPTLPPTATTQAATVVDTTSATLNGLVNANGAGTTVTFEYGLTTAYGSTVTADQSPVTGSTDKAVSAGITGLTTGTTYHFRVVAQNTAGTTYGSDLTFTATAAIPPTATTQAATAVGTATATLSGTVNANGSSTTVTFEYGLTTAYGRTVTADQSPVTGSTDKAVSAGITGLTTGTTYHFRVVAQNTAGTTYGSDLTFTATQPEPSGGDGGDGGGGCFILTSSGN